MVPQHAYKEIGILVYSFCCIAPYNLMNTSRMLHKRMKTIMWGDLDEHIDANVLLD